MAKGKRKALKPVADNGRLDKNGKRILKLLKKNPKFGLFLGAGSGKTRILIRVLFWYLKRNPKRNALIVSMKASILNTWPEQLDQQMRVTGQRFSFHVLHPEYKQLVVPGVNCQYSARIIIVSYEHIRKLRWHYINNYFSFMAVDESVRVKNWSAKATSIVLTFAQQCERVYPMTGLPTPNDMADLYAQVFMLDGGDRLGVNLSQFRRQFMTQPNTQGNQRFVWRTKGYPDIAKMKLTLDEVLQRIRDICVTEETETFVENLPKLDYIDVPFKLKRKEIKAYRKFARDSIIELGPKPTVAASAAVLRNYLLQYVSGNLYDPQEFKLIDQPDGSVKERKLPRTFRRTTKQRMKELDKLLARVYRKRQKLIIAYAFQHNLNDILSVLARHVDMGTVFAVKRERTTAGLVDAWDRQHKHIIVTHAASIGHSLNLQKHGGDIILYSYSDNYDHFYQLLRRLYRRGNPAKRVRCWILQANKSADGLVISNLRSKQVLGQTVMSAARIVDLIRRRVID